MTLLSLFGRRSSATVARERLQILLAHERTEIGRGQSDLIVALREEILAAVARHVSVERDGVHVKMNRGETVSTLEVEIEIRAPSGEKLSIAS